MDVDVENLENILYHTDSSFHYQLRIGTTITYLQKLILNQVISNEWQVSGRHSDHTGQMQFAT